MQQQHIVLIISIASLFVAIAPVALFFGYVAPLLRQHTAVQEALPVPQVTATNAHTFVASHKHKRPHHSQHAFSVSADTPLPEKFTASVGLPRYYQEDRGTCWDFGTVGFLEESYRINGVKKGFLKEGEYVRFSEQAYGISTIRECQNKPDVCDVVGDFVFHNSTEGGEVWWLYYLTNLYHQLLPVSVCPYTPDGRDLECPGMDDALKTNPINFSISTMNTAYTPLATKRLLFEKGVPLSWSAQMFEQAYYFSCDDSYWATRPECADGAAVICPTDRSYNSKRCARVPGPMFDQDGEFFTIGETISGGGHAMLVMGWNDEFVLKNGAKGGFIIKNSWHDETYGTAPSGRGARGSHSIAYWMQQISVWDERAVCPGPLNPDNWLSCVELEAGPHGEIVRKKASRKVGDNYDIGATCLDNAFMSHLLDLSLQPNEFQCLDNSMCHVGDSRYRYFLIEVHRNAAQYLESACMLEYDTATHAQRTVCTPMHIPSQLAYFFKPINSQLEKLKDDEDLCGYWFWSYDTLDKILGLYNNYFSTFFDVQWDDMSYLANAAKFPTRDYTLLKQSSGVLKKMDFGSSPSPFAHRRY